MTRCHQRPPSGPVLLAGGLCAATPGWPPSPAGRGCNLELHVQDNQIVKVTSPLRLFLSSPRSLQARSKSCRSDIPDDGGDSRTEPARTRGVLS